MNESDGLIGGVSGGAVVNVIALHGPADEGGAVPALTPVQAAAWTEWLTANTPSAWRPGEWDAAARLFTGDVDNRSTVAYRCTVAACGRISRTQVLVICVRRRSPSRSWRSRSSGPASSLTATR